MFFFYVKFYNQFMRSVVGIAYINIIMIYLNYFANNFI